MSKERLIKDGPLILAVIFMLAVCLFGGQGCAPGLQAMTGLTEEDMRNAEALRTTAKNLLETWPLHSGMIRGALGDRINEMPYQAIKAMDELDELAANSATLDDFDLGQSLGLRIRLLVTTVREALRNIAPELLQLFTVVL